MSEIAQVTTIDNSGKVQIPETIRSMLGLSPGSNLIIEIQKSNEIRLKPIDEQSQLTYKEGVLVVQSPATEKLENINKLIREERLSQFL